MIYVKSNKNSMKTGKWLKGPKDETKGQEDEPTFP